MPTAAQIMMTIPPQSTPVFLVIQRHAARRLGMGDSIDVDRRWIGSVAADMFDALARYLSPLLALCCL
jgi:hypothetical protein